ncbi:hypothetical protein E2C01_013564 [Portunus trituberculatus]|uniref:Uncharacterized protein n=1 Tax=Portunus trituberculatus TaxID=210409 RepID=A0A5B7DGL4_PORTR|nr:hypothetical protein [Portunus trituberculatus]
MNGGEQQRQTKRDSETCFGSLPVHATPQGQARYLWVECCPPNIPYVTSSSSSSSSGHGLPAALPFRSPAEQE